MLMRKYLMMATMSLSLTLAISTTTLAVDPAVPDQAGNAVSNYNFRVEIEGAPVSGFANVSGLTAEREVIEYRAGDDSLVRKQPGRLTYSNIVLKRGYVSDDVLHDWIQATLVPGAVVERHDGVLILQDKSGNEVVRYNFYEGWPCKWEGPTQTNDGTSIATEIVVLCVDWFQED